MDRAAIYRELNKASIQRTNILKDNKDAFVLEHKIKHNPFKILMFINPSSVKFMIYLKDNGVLEEHIINKECNVITMYNYLVKRIKLL